MWKLQAEKDNIRTYVNTTTNSTCQQRACYTDVEGNRWWEFNDLITIPYTRQFAATKITSLYALNLTPDDVSSFFNKHKATLKSNSPEKYERAYAEVIDFEDKYKAAIDPLRQMSALVCVYFTINDEQIDSFLGDVQAKKMNLLEVEPEMHSFFLKRQISLIENYKSFLSQTLATASDQFNAS